MNFAAVSKFFDHYYVHYLALTVRLCSYAWCRLHLLVLCLHFILKVIVRVTYGFLTQRNDGCADLDCILRRLLLAPIQSRLFGKAVYCECAAITSTTAHTILGRCKPDSLDVSKGTDFVVAFGRPIESREVLEDAHVVLYSVTTTHAIFVRTRKPKTEYTAEHCAFWWWDLFLDAQEVITMPLNDFEGIVQECLPQLKDSQLVFLYSYGRSGSTFLAKLLEGLAKDVYCFSEPDCMTYPFYLPKLKGFPEERLSSLMRTIFTYVCLSMPNTTERTLFVFKPRFFALDFAPRLQRMFPDSKFLFIHRQPLKIVRSYEKAFQNYSTSVVLQMLFRCRPLCEFIAKRGIDFSFLVDKEEFLAAWRYLEPSTFEIAVRLYAWMYRLHEKHALTVPFYNVTYEALLENPHDTMTMLFNYLRPGEKSAMLQSKRQDIMEHIFEEDSQKGTPLSQETLARNTTTTVTLAMRDRIDQYLNALKVASLWPKMQTVRKSVSGC